jgi:iron complex outermembrane receptor protein
MNTLLVTKLQSCKAAKLQNKIDNLNVNYLLLFSFHKLRTLHKLTLDEVLVSAVRVTTQTPVSFSNLTKKEIKFRNLDRIFLFDELFAVCSHDIRCWKRSGIHWNSCVVAMLRMLRSTEPYNDSESHGTYWVNMPDFASSLESVQLQRGVDFY